MQKSQCWLSRQMLRFVRYRANHTCISDQSCDISSGCDDDVPTQANLLAAQSCTVLLFPPQMSSPQLRMPMPQQEQSNSRSDLPHRGPHLVTFSSLRRASAVLSISLARFCSQY